MSIGFLKIGSYYRGKYYGSVKDLKSLESHLKYIGFRSRELGPEKHRFFNEKSNAADWRSFYKNIEQHRALRHSRSVKAHKMIFSMRKRDYDAYRASGRDYKDIVRKVLNDYEIRKGVKLDWIAVSHDINIHHPHCHVVVRAVSEPWPDGTSKRIFFSKDDIHQLKQSFDLEVERHRVIEIDRRHEYERYERDFMMDFINDLGKSIEYEIRKKQQEMEYEKELNTRKRGR